MCHGAAGAMHAVHNHTAVRPAVAGGPQLQQSCRGRHDVWGRVGGCVCAWGGGPTWAPDAPWAGPGVIVSPAPAVLFAVAPPARTRAKCCWRCEEVSDRSSWHCMAHQQCASRGPVSLHGCAVRRVPLTTPHPPPLCSEHPVAVPCVHEWMWRCVRWDTAQHCSEARAPPPGASTQCRAPAVLRRQAPG